MDGDYVCSGYGNIPASVKILRSNEKSESVYDNADDDNDPSSFFPPLSKDDHVADESVTTPIPSKLI